MSLKLECHSKWNVTQNFMLPKMECHLKCNFNQNWMSLKIECYSKWNVTKKLNVTLGTSLKLEGHSNLNVSQI